MCGLATGDPDAVGLADPVLAVVGLESGDGNCASVEKSVAAVINCLSLGPGA
jgi:hypothetical protein